LDDKAVEVLKSYSRKGLRKTRARLPLSEASNLSRSADSRLLGNSRPLGKYFHADELIGTNVTNGCTLIL
jgi:hypothetical protein